METDYQCVFTVLPGQLLAEMYDRYGAKLLQRNVRSFLQLRGKVNKGIIETVRDAPDRFLAYNNGISATATGLVTDDRADGTYLVKLDDLQIVNGGQTTATLHHAAVREGIDLSQVQVPAKITVVRPEQLDQLVPKISRYANSQNAIAEADLSPTVLSTSSLSGCLAPSGHPRRKVRHASPTGTTSAYAACPRSTARAIRPRHDSGASTSRTLPRRNSPRPTRRNTR